ncbi:hypothetical protein HYN56_06475 [Flavobacterium crocinum]|uniref:Uncharacterized protein n=1 Tax=Flavobacterium crocinum TaxID=2183896 RepID=A0A2S1YIM9_9FLAO|nr:hypothetical protein [Flavobacterium crocinum]AWK03892.1 hypothetical protein HYN56_06475 [Flavobacterium crocinum]
MKKLILIATLFLLVSCSSDDDNASGDITITSVGQGSLSSSTIEQKNIVITNKITWEALKAKMNEYNKNTTEYYFKETDIDFSKFNIIAAFYKQHSNSSTSIDITKATIRSGTIFVQVENLKVGITNDVAQPFHIVKIPKSSKNILFEKIKNPLLPE